MQQKRCKQADRKMSKRYVFLMRIFIASIFMNSYFLVKFVLMHLSEISEDNNHAIQHLMKQKRSLLLDDPVPQSSKLKTTINAKKNEPQKTITEAKIEQLAKLQKRYILTDSDPLRGNIEKPLDGVESDVMYKPKPLYKKETLALEATFSKQVASFYDKYNKVYKSFVIVGDDKHNNELGQLNSDDGTPQFLTTDTYNDKKAKIKRKKKNSKQLEEIISNSNKDLCRTPSDLLIVVNSSPKNIKQRLAIRYSWAEENGWKRKSSSEVTTTQRQNSQVMFAIGTQTLDSKTKTMLDMEFEEYKDIIMLNSIVDNYQNLALKTMNTLKWISENCESYFVMKTDDDCFVNKRNILEFLQRQGIGGDLYAGRVQWSMPAIRERNSKFYVPYSVHPGFFLHPYASGGGYVISWNLLKGLVNKSKQLNTIPIEDANVGNVLYSMNVKPSDIRDFLPFIYCNTTSVWDRPPCDYVKPYVIHGIDPYGQLWMQYHMTVLTTIQSICKQENKHRHKFDPPYYCPVDLAM